MELIFKQNSFKYFVRFQPGQTVYIPGSFEEPHEFKSFLEESAKDTTLPRSRGTLTDKPKERTT